MIQIKGLLIAAAAASVLGFGTGYKVKGDQVAAAEKKKAEKALADFEVYAQGVVSGLQEDWVRVAAETGDALSIAAEQREKDAQAERKALGAIWEVRNEISKLSKQIRVVENVGACRLGTDFIRLRNEAIEAANTGTPSG